MPQLPPLAAPHVEAASESVGVESPFWESDDEGAVEEGMFRLALELDVPDVQTLLGALPPGYAAVFDIFIWEQRRAMSGFSTSPNVGIDHVHRASAAYARVGMGAEAEALRRVAGQLQATPGDHALAEAAYQAAPNPHSDDWRRIPELIRILVMDQEKYFYGVG